jgi:hypothetical protein
MARNPEKWIKDALPESSKGKLHKKLKIPAGEKIPDAKIMKAEKSKNPTLRKEAVLAQTLKGMRRK